jgi:hypothetical protein
MELHAYHLPYVRIHGSRQSMYGSLQLVPKVERSFTDVPIVLYHQFQWQTYAETLIIISQVASTRSANKAAGSWPKLLAGKEETGRPMTSGGSKCKYPWSSSFPRPQIFAKLWCRMRTACADRRLYSSTLPND